MYRKKMELNELVVRVCVCVCAYDMCEAMSCLFFLFPGVCAHNMSCLCACVFLELEPSPGACALRAHFPGVPHFQLICCSLWLLICLRGACWVGGLGMWARWQLQRRCSLEQNAEGHRAKSHFPIITLNSSRPQHSTKVTFCSRDNSSYLINRLVYHLAGQYIVFISLLWYETVYRVLNYGYC